MTLTQTQTKSAGTALRKLAQSQQAAVHNAVLDIVDAWGIEPEGVSEGSISKELGLNLFEGRSITDEEAAKLAWKGVIYCALAGREKLAYPIVRVSGQTVLNPAQNTYSPGQWESTLIGIAAGINAKRELTRRYQDGELRIAA